MNIPLNLEVHISFFLSFLFCVIRVVDRPGLNIG